MSILACASTGSSFASFSCSEDTQQDLDQEQGGGVGLDGREQDSDAGQDDQGQDSEEDQKEDSEDDLEQDNVIFCGSPAKIS